MNSEDNANRLAQIRKRFPDDSKWDIFAEMDLGLERWGERERRGNTQYYNKQGIIEGLEYLTYNGYVVSLDFYLRLYSETRDKYSIRIRRFNSTIYYINDDLETTYSLDELKGMYEFDTNNLCDKNLDEKILLAYPKNNNRELTKNCVDFIKKERLNINTVMSIIDYDFYTQDNM
jgi:hypothetical protein